MENMLECMCMECGVSIHLDAGLVTTDSPEDARGRALNGQFCPECGGPLILVGRAGDEPFYRLQ